MEPSLQICFGIFLSPPEEMPSPSAVTPHFPCTRSLQEGSSDWGREGGKGGSVYWSSKLHVPHRPAPAFAFCLISVLFPLPPRTLLWLPSSSLILCPHTLPRQPFPRKRMFQPLLSWEALHSSLGNPATRLTSFLRGTGGWWVKCCRNRLWGVTSLGWREPLPSPWSAAVLRK